MSDFQRPPKEPTVTKIVDCGQIEHHYRHLWQPGDHGSNYALCKGLGHPEAHCHRCQGPNVTWTAPSPLWNMVMRDGSMGGDEIFDGIVCPRCFMELAENSGVASLWRVYPERVQIDLETMTPDGRVWNPETWLWDGPLEPEPAPAVIQIRAMNPGSFQSGDWAELEGTDVIGGVPCFLVRFPDGMQDQWAMDDSLAGYEFRQEPELGPTEEKIRLVETKIHEEECEWSLADCLRDGGHRRTAEAIINALGVTDA